MRTGSVIAADLGASSGRVMLGRVGADTLELTEVRRFRNGPVTLPDGLHWDVLGLYLDVLTGIRDCARADPEVLGIAVDSWAVDYGVVDRHGALQGNPVHYRDQRHAAGVAAVHARIDAVELFGVNGLQQLPFNTVFQLAADPLLPAPGSSALLIPDLLGYWLTGERVAEQTNASTTGLLDARTADWSPRLLEMLDLPVGLLPPVVVPGVTIGRLTAGALAETGLNPAALLTTVGSHDTASAVVGVPADDDEFAYISCGTWGLVGVELDHPVLTDETRRANFTNERGVDGTIRFLRNVMGLWLLQESLRTWRVAGHDHPVDELLAAAAALPRGGPTVDPNDPVFLPPGDMPARIADACTQRGLAPPTSPAQVVRCVLDSLADAFARSVSDAAGLSGKLVKVVHIVGGGSANRLLCQLVSNACGLPVHAGPVEATALGNVLIQARTHGLVDGDLSALRQLLRATNPVVVYTPEAS